MACKTDWYLNCIKIERLPSSQTNVATPITKKKAEDTALLDVFFWQTVEVISCSWNMSSKNASGINSREMLLNGSESFAFVQGKSL